MFYLLSSDFRALLLWMLSSFSSNEATLLLSVSQFVMLLGNLFFLVKKTLKVHSVYKLIIRYSHFYLKLHGRKKFQDSNSIQRIFQQVVLSFKSLSFLQPYEDHIKHIKWICLTQNRRINKAKQFFFCQLLRNQRPLTEHKMFSFQPMFRLAVYQNI